MTYELSRMFGTGRLAFLHGYATGMSKYDKPLSLEDVHDTAEMFMAELDAAIKEIESVCRERDEAVTNAETVADETGHEILLAHGALDDIGAPGKALSLEERIWLLNGWRRSDVTSLRTRAEAAETHVAELKAEIERDPRKRYAVVDSAGCDCGTCQEIRRQQGRKPQETVASRSYEADWYDPVPQDPSLYRDCYCDDHGDCQAIFRNNEWRCVICGNPVTVSEPQEA